jgi:hypothetical protein
MATAQSAAGSARPSIVEHSSASPGVERFLALEERGLRGSFELSYHVNGYPGGHGLSGDGTLVVAQRATPGTSAWPTGPGEWSFHLTQVPDAVFQWVEFGNKAEDCWAWPRHPTMTCTGPGTYSASNGFILSTLAFIPGSVFVDLKADVGGVDGQRGEPASVFRAEGSAITGPLLCLRTDVTDSWTVCLTNDGVVASVAPFVKIGISFGSLVLAASPSIPPASAFVLDEHPAMPFLLPPT